MSRLQIRLLTLLILTNSLVACTSLGPDWRLTKQRDGIDYYARQSAQKSLPEFKATVKINASIPDVMQVVTDFNRYPEWVYQCQETRVIALKGYSEAYIYQINSLPVIKDRDIILHGVTHRSEDGQQMQIQLNAAPHYCENNDDEDCVAIVESPYVRVTDATGEFTLTKIDNHTTEIVWQQYLDPAGAIPHWLFRAMMARVPLQSLQKLKTIVEANQ